MISKRPYGLLLATLLVGVTAYAVPDARALLEQAAGARPMPTGSIDRLKTIVVLVDDNGQRCARTDICERITRRGERRAWSRRTCPFAFTAAEFPTLLIGYIRSIEYPRRHAGITTAGPLETFFFQEETDPLPLCPN